MRVKIIRIYPEILMNLLKGSIVQCIENKLTTESRMVNGGYDVNTAEFYLVVEDPKFDEVELGQQLPELRPILQRISNLSR